MMAGVRWEVLAYEIVDIDDVDGRLSVFRVSRRSLSPFGARFSHTPAFCSSGKNPRLPLRMETSDEVLPASVASFVQTV